MNDIAKKRDDHFQDLQRLTGSTLAAIGPAILNLLGEDRRRNLNIYNYCLMLKKL